MSTLAVLGATGGLGRAVTALSLADGHSVRALARRPDGLTDHDRLHPVQGSFQDPDALRQVLVGADAVLSCVGHTGKQDPAVFGEGMRHLIALLRQPDHTDRLVAISGAGLVLDGDAMPLSRRLILTALKLFSPRVLAGKQAEWEALHGADDVAWTLVRAPRMVKGDAPARPVQADATAVIGKPMVPYPDIARWMIDTALAEPPTWVRQAPFLSGS